MIYTKFVNTGEQVLRLQDLLPFPIPRVVAAQDDEIFRLTPARPAHRGAVAPRLP